MRFSDTIPSGPHDLGGETAAGAPDASPARRALHDAEAKNHTLGHENRGALSSTHGFLPLRTPAVRLPRELAELDSIAEDLPALFANLGLRKRLDRLSPLQRELAGLPEPFLQRAATILGLFAQAYWHCEPRPPQRVPAALEEAWGFVCQRLGREVTAFTYNDGIINNFRIPGQDGGTPYDPHAQLAERMLLLVPTIDNAEERIFYLTQVAALMHASTVVEAATRLQECVLADDRHAAKGLLAYVRDVVQHLTDVTFMVIDPNPASKTFVDPTMWTRTVANTFLPFRPGPPGPSGTAAPFIHVLDVLFGRKQYDATKISVETIEMRHHWPPHWRAFLKALDETSLCTWAKRQDDPELDGILGQALLSHAGDNGFLGRHRLKVYGFLDTAFKLGRDATIGGFSQLLVDRTWDHVHNQLALMRDERVAHVGGAALTHVAKVETSVSTIESQDVSSANVQRVRLDVSGCGVRYRPGDRIAILPVNDPRLVGRTLGALELDGGAEIRLDKAWQAALLHRPRFRRGGVPESLPLRELLRWARLRPVSVAQAEQIRRMAPSPAVIAMVDNHLENEVELWDFMVLARQTFPAFTEALAKARADGTLITLLPPEEFRLYSIASAPDGQRGPSSTIDLVLTRWQYATRDAVTPTTAALAHTVRPTFRQGTASTYLIREAQNHDTRARELFKKFDVNGDGELSRDEVCGQLIHDGIDPATAERMFSTADRDKSSTLGLEEFSRTIARQWFDNDTASHGHEVQRVIIQILSPPRFSLPDDTSAPVVMFAAGTGISPFRSFWQARATESRGAMTLLYFATRREEELYLRTELEDMERKGALRTRVAFSEGKTRARFDAGPGRFVFDPAPSEMINDVMQEEREAALLYRLILPKDRGGLGGHFYICGRAGYANTVLESLKRIITRFHTNISGSLEPPANEVLRKLVAENRLCMEIFTTHRGQNELPQTFRPSDLVLHNNAKDGYWLLVHGRILDVTEFRLLHPGGPQIIDNYAGIDATKAYVAVAHHMNPEVHAMAGMYEIGRLDRVALPTGAESVELEHALRTWIKTTYAVTECENLLENEYSVQDKIVQGGTAPGAPAGLRTLYGITAQQRMEVRYIQSLFGDRLHLLWQATIPVGEKRDPEEARSEVTRVESTAAAAARRGLGDQLLARLDAVATEPWHPEHTAIRRAVSELRVRNQTLLRDLKLTLHGGLKRLERMEAATVKSTALSLERILLSVPLLLEAHTNETLAIVRRHGFAAPS